jgi:hypothetical protein
MVSFQYCPRCHTQMNVTPTFPPQAAQALGMCRMCGWPWDVEAKQAPRGSAGNFYPQSRRSLRGLIVIAVVVAILLLGFIIKHG